MTSSPLAPPVLGTPGRLPRGVATALLDRRIALVARRDGPVLDLSSPLARAEVVAAARGEGADLPAGYPTVTSVLGLACFPDLAVALQGIRRLLAADGVLEAVEPVGRPGMGATALATAWAAHPAVASLHVSRDVPAAVRHAGFTITDIERFTMPTTVWPLRAFVALRAQWIDTGEAGR